MKRLSLLTTIGFATGFAGLLALAPVSVLAQTYTYPFPSSYSSYNQYSDPYVIPVNSLRAASCQTIADPGSPSDVDYSCAGVVYKPSNSGYLTIDTDYYSSPSYETYNDVNYGFRPAFFRGYGRGYLRYML